MQTKRSRLWNIEDYFTGGYTAVSGAAPFLPDGRDSSCVLIRSLGLVPQSC